MGTIVLGKIESGTLQKGQTVSLMPNKVQLVCFYHFYCINSMYLYLYVCWESLFWLQCPVEILQLWSNDDEVEQASPGENVKCKLRNIEEDVSERLSCIDNAVHVQDVSPGFVLCPTGQECLTGRLFDAQLVILEHKSIICAGYSAVMHLHTSAEEITIKVELHWAQTGARVLNCIRRWSVLWTRRRATRARRDRASSNRTRLPLCGWRWAAAWCASNRSSSSRRWADSPFVMKVSLSVDDVTILTCVAAGKTIAIGKVLKVIA